MAKKNGIITIDGPSGVGKSTVSRKVAAATGYTYLDTGAMYRGVGLYLQQQQIDLSDTEAIVEKLRTLDLQLTPAVDEVSDVGVLVNGVDVSREIRTPAIAMAASAASAVPAVREVLTQMQQAIGRAGRIVAEGRDTGTVVFPNATNKFYLDAQPEERAQRRCAQLLSKGIVADFEEVLAQTLIRDKNDSQRDIAPLRPAEDAVYIDTTALDIDAVVAKIIAIVNRN
jgi:cytidylate kinase